MTFVALGILAFIGASALRHPASGQLITIAATLTALFFGALAIANARAALRSVTVSR